MGYIKRNVDKQTRNNKQQTTGNTIQYVTKGDFSGNKDGADAYSVYITPDSHVFTGGPIYATDNQSDRLFVFGFRGNKQIDTLVTSIDGTITNALSATVRNNGTNQTYIDVSVNSLLYQKSGTLTINVKVNLNMKDSSSGYDASVWDTSSGISFATKTLKYSWALATTGESNYKLDLTNENASINCDVSGNILSGARRPTCTAQLYYGKDIASNPSYSLAVPSGTTGVSINASTGVLTFNAGSASVPFNFTGTSTELTVTGYDNDVSQGVAIMNVVKSYPGHDGQDGRDGSNGIDGSNGADAVSYWLSLSADAIHVDKNNTCSPSTITATGYKQVGENNPVTASDCTIKYGYDTTSPSSTYSSAITVDYSKSYLSFAMYKGSNLVDGIETVPILKDGQDGSTGQQGPQGLKGAVMRGPVKWEDQTTTRRFCNGVYNSSYPEDAQWIDIIIKDSSYYYCNTSYTGSCSDTWSSVSSKWTVADEQLSFVATKLLLAQNAAISFLSTNELRLMNDANTQVVAGAMGGSGINFYAGSSTPGTAPFQVSYDGAIKATKGTFSGYVQMPYYFISSLSHTGTYYDGGYLADEHAYLIADDTCGYYGMGDGGILLLPEPTASLNGFTYHIIAQPNVATKSAGLNPSISTMTLNKTNKFLIYAYTNTYGVYNRLSFYGGHIELTCIPVHYNSLIQYYWAVTNCTGGVDCYTGSEPSYSGNWTVNGDTLVSNTISDSQNTWEKIKWSGAGTVTVQITASSETNYDKGYIGPLDSSATTSNSVVCVSGTDSSTYTFTTTSSGEHYVQVGYVKDGSRSVNNDNVTVICTYQFDPDFSEAYSTVCGYSTTNNYYAIAKIQADPTMPTSKNADTLYISRS